MTSWLVPPAMYNELRNCTTNAPQIVLYSPACHVFFPLSISFLKQFTKESFQSHMCIVLGILNSFPCSQRAFLEESCSVPESRRASIK